MAGLWTLLLGLAAALAATAQEAEQAAEGGPERAGASREDGGELGIVPSWSWSARQRTERSLDAPLGRTWRRSSQDEEASQAQDGGGAGAGHDGGTIFWVTRGKKGIEEYLPFYWGPNQSVWGETLYRSGPAPPQSRQQQDLYPSHSLPLRSGWESNQSLWGKRNGRDPFWVARGKRPEGGPFWVSRGRRDPAAQTPASLPLLEAGEPRSEGGDAGPTWDSGEDGDVDKREDGGPFWISRGKRTLQARASPQQASLWSARGRKSGEERTFWAARGKKEADSRAPFWIARGKKNTGATAAGPYWIARGKKEQGVPGFWVSRGKKDPPSWVVRGRREEANHPFWIARGKRSKGARGRGAATPAHRPSSKEKHDNDDDGEEEQEGVTKDTEQYPKRFAELSG